MKEEQKTLREKERYTRPVLEAQELLRDVTTDVYPDYGMQSPPPPE